MRVWVSGVERSGGLMGRGREVLQSSTELLKIESRSVSGVGILGRKEVAWELGGRSSKGGKVWG